jgi:signal transduction histidine kinase
MEDIAINEVVQQVATRHEPDLYRKSQRYTEEIVREPLMVHADTRQISQAITNLIGNAVKYTPEGGSVTVRVYQREDVARIEVIDTGYGMPADALPKLFTEFYRVRTPATQNIKGTGLGLSLVKQVIDAHNGRIWVESEEGKGSAFFVEIPLIHTSEATS